MGVGAIIGIFIGVMSLLFGLKNQSQQEQQFQYSKDVQQQIFGREDTSIQRRVADLKASGLSPVLAAGSGANAGQAVQTQAPQFDLNSLTKGSQVGSDVTNLFKSQQEILGNQASIALMAEQMKTQRTQQVLNQANAGKSYWQSAIDAYELGLARKPGVSTKGGLATDIIKTGTGISDKHVPPILHDIYKGLNKGWDMYNKGMDNFWKNNFKYNNKPIFGGN